MVIRLCIVYRLTRFIVSEICLIFQREYVIILLLMAGATGFEPAIFPVTGERVNQATPRAHTAQRPTEPDPVPTAGIEPAT